MNVIHYIKILLRYTTWLIILPVMCAVTVFFLTKNAKKKYTSSTTLYTGVASGYSITSTEDERLDYFAVNNAFDNLLASAKSRETIQQVALQLLAEHLLLTKPDPQVLDAPGFENLQKIAGTALIAKARQLKDEQHVYDYLNRLYSSQNDNEITNILNKTGSYYSIDDLKSNLVVTRINTSDLIQVVYTCTDPAVCLRTLQLHSSIFIANYKRLKSDQTNSAVQYFEAKLAESKKKLEGSENALKEFGQKNRVINYYEQTRYVAEAKENLDKEIYAEKVAQKGSKQALSQVEKKLSSRESQVENGLNLMDLRKRLSDANDGLEKAKVFNDKTKIAAYAAQVKALGDSLKAASNQYLNVNYSLEAIPRPDLIRQYVDNAVATEKSTAGLAVLNNQKQNYLDEIDQLAPLGSTIKRLDRQADINEKEYLAILNGLHLARLRQSNLSLNSNIVVQDKPFFPLRAQPSTSALLIALSFFAGLISVAGIAIGREFMDSSVRSPERVKKIINMPVAGVSIAGSDDGMPYRQALRRLLAERFVANILPVISGSVDETGQALLSMVSVKAGSYQRADIGLLHETLSEVYPGLTWVVPTAYEQIFADALPSSALSVYKPTVQQLNYKNVQQLVSHDLSQNQLVIYISPDQEGSGIPSGIIKASDMLLLAFRATDTWLPMHKEILSKLKAIVTDKPFSAWLINTDEANLDGIIGEIPKKRSWLRKKVKKLITLNLK
ncbi:MAG TPA: hypothetical protein VHA56_05025 [Mucilaginibacter sp.]|nr:hypothetical protein [Mucilaginibacter sp.]